MQPIDIVLTITIMAQRYNVDPELALRIAWLESSMNPAAVGDTNAPTGTSVGLWQFQLGTWRYVREKMGRSTEDLRTEVIESTETAMFALGMLNMYSHWSTWPVALKQLRKVE